MVGGIFPPPDQEAPVALQGDLSSFALPDVLRLLAGTAKSGCLEVVAPGTTGEVWLRDGGVVGGAISTAPHALEPSDVVFEMLRLAEGRFVFDDTEEIDEAASVSVEEALATAEALVAEWVEVESVVPSMDAWVTFAPEIDGPETTIRAEAWRTLAAVGNGGSVGDLADALELTDLAACRQVKALVDAGHVQLRSDHVPSSSAPRRAEVEEPAEADGYDELEVLRADDRPVLLETREDALLPEPLPGEGISYASDAVVGGYVDGIVDGPSFDTVDHEAPDTRLADQRGEITYNDDTGYTADLPSIHEQVRYHDAPAPVAEPAREGGGFMFGDDIPRHDFHGQSQADSMGSYDEDDDADDVGAPAYDPLASTFGEAPVDEDRGSLLKFLSTVQP